MSSNPYREPAEMPKVPKEKRKVSEKLQIIRMIMIAAVLTVTVVTGSLTYIAIENNRAQVIKNQVDKDIAHSHYLEAKANSDKAMFEEMAKRQPPSSK